MTAFATAAHCIIPGVPSSLCGGGIFNLSGLATSIAKAMLDGIVAWVAAGAAWLLGQVAVTINRAGNVDLGASWFTTHLATMARLAAVLALAALLAAAIDGIVTQRGTEMIRAVVVRLPTAGVVTAGAVVVTEMALSITDQLCSLIAAGTGNQVASMLKVVAETLVVANPLAVGIPGFLTVVLGLLVSLAALCLLIELLLRAAAIYIAVLFLPLVMAASVWPRLGGWSRRLIETLAGLIVAKFVIVSVLVLAAAELSSGIAHRGITAVLSGVAMLLLAAFAPFAVLRLIPIAEGGAHGALEGHRQRATRATTAGAMTAQRIALAVPTGGASAEAELGRLVAAGSQASVGAIGDSAGDLGSQRVSPVIEAARTDTWSAGSPPLVESMTPSEASGDDQVRLLPRVSAITGGRHGLGSDELGVQLRWIPNDQLDPGDRA